MARGGARKGAGRPKGASTTKTREIADRAVAEGLTPIDFMLTLMRDDANDVAMRFEAAKAAAPYIHPKLAAVAHTGADGGELSIVFKTVYED